jgi:hypothetical protein
MDDECFYPGGLPGRDLPALRAALVFQDAGRRMNGGSHKSWAAVRHEMNPAWTAVFFEPDRPTGSKNLSVLFCMRHLAEQSLVLAPQR